MRVFIVGGTGLLGQHAAAELVRRGHEVSVSGRRRPPSTLEDRARFVPVDLETLDEDGWAALLFGQEAVVFAAGVDDRAAPKAPAVPYFHAGNVVPVQDMLAAAKRTGVRRAVVIGSYFTAIDRQRPAMRLAARHPYIASRVAQAHACRRAAGPDLSVALLETPFVFGAVPGRDPLWAPLVGWLRAGRPCPVPPGGTAVITAAAMGQAVGGALERGADGAFPVAQENLAWDALVARIGAALGRPPRVRRLPAALLRAALGGAGLGYRARGREPGLTPGRLTELLTAELFLDPAVAAGQLGVSGHHLDDGLREMIAACPQPGQP
ncbi:NAD-dependent epimerase/dehydratase family protein [Pilimelia columellifera]|uniref:SDR family oxidoreductase n=1 Tax=Pilimelia columellifera subsp. columellifera TaxID=706583 RepID=A0ABN3NN75_9ACTN